MAWMHNRAYNHSFSSEPTIRAPRRRCLKCAPSRGPKESRVRIRLIEPEPPGMNVFSKVMFPRLGLPAIGAALTSQGHDVCIYVPQFSAIDWNDVL